MKTEIISTELPSLIRSCVDSCNLLSDSNIKDEFIQAQKQAILRFCEAVEKEVETTYVIQTLQAGKMLNLKYANAMKKLRDELRVGTVPQTEQPQTPDPSR